MDCRLASLVFIRWFIASVVSVLVLSGCNDSKKYDDVDDQQSDDAHVVLEGTVQKGVFISLSVNAIVLDPQGTPTETLSAEVKNGGYSVRVPSGRPVRLEASGTFQDELTGNEVTLSQPLEAFVLEPLEDPSININILTHLVAKQTLARIAAGASASDAFELAQQVVRNAIGLSANTRVVDLDILNIQSESDLQDPNLQLLLFSAAVLNEWPAEEGTVFGDAFFDVFVPEFAALDDGTDALQALSPFMGMNAQALYEQVQDVGVITDLPELDQSLDNGQFVCSGGGECGWEINNTPTIAMSAGVVYESQGQVLVRFRLSQAPETPLEINVRTVAGTAEEFSDYVPLATTLTINPHVAEFSVPIALLIDQTDEGNERFSLVIEGDVSGYELANREASILIGDGYQSQPWDADVYANYVSIDDVCLQNIFVPTQPSDADCANTESFIAFHAGLEAAADISVVLSGQCDSNAGVGCVSTVLNNHWLVALELVELTDGTETAAVELGVYQYGSSAIKNNIAQRFQMTLPDEAKTLLQAAHTNQNSKTVIARAKLLASTSNNHGTETITAYSVGPAIEAEDISIQLAASGWNFTTAEQQPDAGCVNDEYVLSGSFSTAGDIVNSATVCIELDSQGQWELASGEIPLAGDQIPLPAFHGMFVRYGDGRLVPKGGSVLLIPEESDSSEVQDIPGLTLQRLGLDRVYSGFQLPETINTADIFLHKEGLPVAFKVIGAELTPDGVKIRYEDAEYLHAGFSGVDIRDKGQYASNDILFSGASGAGELLLTGNGLSGELTIASATTGENAFPRGWISLQENANFEITHSEIASSENANAVFIMSQDDTCKEADCSQSSLRSYAMATELDFASGGHQLSVAEITARRTPAFGYQSDGQHAIELPDQFQVGQQVMLAMPGYSFSNDAEQNVGTALLGHLNQASGETILYESDSLMAQLGNYWPTGVSVGPEIFYATADQGVVGELLIQSGTDLEKRIITLRSPSGGLSYSKHGMDLQTASKYVVRNAGVTGVFNIHEDSLLNPYFFSSFDIKFDRFGFRAVDNAIDEYSYIDGSMHLGNDADIDIVFSSLGIRCSGYLGGASPEHHDCSNPPSLSNCGQRLASWKSPIELYSLQFEASSGDQCVNSEPQLRLFHLMDMVSLNKSLEVNSVWDGDGNFKDDSVLTASADYRLEVPGSDRKQGFAIRPASGAMEVQDIGGQRYGTVTLLDTYTRLPLWNAVSSDVRLANETTELAEPAVVAPSGMLRTSRDDVNLAQYNQALQNDFINDTDLDFSARYQWGGSGFGFNLPVYYSPASFNDNQKPQFIGRYQTSDLIVMEAGAGINFVTPQTTQLSFGVSANVEKVAISPFRFSLSAGGDLSSLDNYLVDFGILQQPIFEPNFGELKNLFAGMGEFSNIGIDRLIRESLTSRSDAVFEFYGQNPFESISRTMMNITSFAPRVTTTLDTSFKFPVETSLQQATDIGDNILQMLHSVSTLTHGDLDTNHHDAQQALEQVRSLRANLIGWSQDIEQAILRVNADMLTSLLDGGDALVSLQGLYDLLRVNNNGGTTLESSLAQLVQVGNGICDTSIDIDFGQVDEVQASYLYGVFTQLGRMQSIADRVKSIGTLMADISNLTQGDSQADSTLLRVQQQAARQAAQLESLIDRTAIVVRNAACSEQSDLRSNLLAEVNVLIQQQRSAIEAIYVNFNTSSGSSPRYLSIISELETLVINEKLNPLLSAVKGVDGALGIVEFELSNYAARAHNVDPLDNAGNVFLELAALYLGEATEGSVGRFSRDFDLGPISPIPLAVDEYFQAELVSFSASFDEITSQYLELMQVNAPMAQLTAPQIQDLYISKIMQGAAITNLRQVISSELNDVSGELTDINVMVADAVNFAIKKALAPIDSNVNALFTDANAALNAVPIRAAEIDGSAKTEGDAIGLININASWALASGDGSSDATEFNASMKAAMGTFAEEITGCEVDDNSNPIAVSIGTYGMPLSMMGSDLELQELSFLFAMETDSSNAFAYLPRDISSTILTLGEIGFSEFALLDLGLMGGVGADQNFLGARGGALFGNQSLEAAFFVGDTCTSEQILSLDRENVGKYLPLDDNGFTGIYARGRTTFPVYANGCAANLNADAEAGAWFFNNKPGGLVGGGMYGTAACLGSVRGKINTAMTFIGTDVYFVGDGYAVAGVGDCSPGKWTSVGRSRGDDWCGTGDVTFGASYKDGSFEVSDLKFSASH